jgi:hypothetical protein
MAISKINPNSLGGAPCFSAYQSSAQTLSGATWTKLQFQTKEWDTTTAFDATTNYRFQPTVAGYYLVNGGLVVASTQTNILFSLYKNGLQNKLMQMGYNAQSSTYGCATVYLNGSTDYIELYGYLQGGQALSVGSSNTYFQATFVRGA